MADENGLSHRRKVRMMFEPGRLGDLYLMDAYERLVPVVRRASPAARLGSKRQAMPHRQESQR